MPWTVLPTIDRSRHQRRSLAGRPRGVCHDAIELLITRTSATLRRRGTDDMAAVTRLITGAGHCVPCISLLTGHDARRIYAALERLNDAANVKLVRSGCARCRRTTTVYLIEG